MFIKVISLLIVFCLCTGTSMHYDVVVETFDSAYDFVDDTVDAIKGITGKDVFNTAENSTFIVDKLYIGSNGERLYYGDMLKRCIIDENNIPNDFDIIAINPFVYQVERVDESGLVSYYHALRFTIRGKDSKYFDENDIKYVVDIDVLYIAPCVYGDVGSDIYKNYPYYSFNGYLFGSGSVDVYSKLYRYDGDNFLTPVLDFNNLNWDMVNLTTLWRRYNIKSVTYLNNDVIDLELIFDLIYATHYIGG